MSNQHLSNLTVGKEVVGAEPFIAVVFTRHSLHLHTLLLENQPWFCARDLGRLMDGIWMSERLASLTKTKREP